MPNKESAWVEADGQWTIKLSVCCHCTLSSQCASYINANGTYMCVVAAADSVVNPQVSDVYKCLWTLAWLYLNQCMLFAFDIRK